MSRKVLLLENPTNNEWIARYNEKVMQLADVQPRRKVTTVHHIFCRSDYPELANEPANIVFASFADHMDLHYYLWKFDPRFSAQLWFGCVYGRKNKLWDLPGGESEYAQLKADLRAARAYRKQQKNL